MKSLVRWESLVCESWIWASLLLWVVSVNANRPDGFVLQVRPYCKGYNGTDALVTVVTDLPDVAVSGSCSNGPANFTSKDDVNHVLPVFYNDQGSAFCTFTKKRNANIFTLVMSITYGEAGRQIQQHTEVYTVTCTLDPNKKTNSSQQTIAESLGAPKELQVNKGLDTSSSLTLTLVDILGDPIPQNENIITGRKVQLRLTTNGNSSEVGVRPTSCIVTDPHNGNSHSILRAGCGDGVVLPRHSGFNTTGLTSLSPYFDYYGLENASALAFECNITVCNSACDGSSCVVGRKRRSVKRFVPEVTVTSPVFRSPGSV